MVDVSDYIPLLPLLIVVAMMLHKSKAFSNIVINIGYGYFIGLTVVFVIVRERISFLYEHPPIPAVYWE
mgnify:CR=1 FL=1